MANPTTGAGFALSVERTIAAPPERVFDAFTQAQQLARWFGPTNEYGITVHALEARTGGRYRIEMRHSGGNVHVVAGVYEEVSRPSRHSSPRPKRRSSARSSASRSSDASHGFRRRAAKSWSCATSSSSIPQRLQRVWA